VILGPPAQQEVSLLAIYEFATATCGAEENKKTS
jgi:hypothetical protein